MAPRLLSEPSALGAAATPGDVGRISEGNLPSLGDSSSLRRVSVPGGDRIPVEVAYSDTCPAHASERRSGTTVAPARLFTGDLRQGGHGPTLEVLQADAHQGRTSVWGVGGTATRGRVEGKWGLGRHEGHGGSRRIHVREWSSVERTHMAAMTRVLVSYASRFGSTREVATRIADRLRVRGCEVRVCSVEDGVSMNGYEAVVLGSGVYDGSWTTDATAFVRRQAGDLAHKPVWLFSVGSFGDRHPVIGRLMLKEPKEIGEFEQLIHPRGYRVFAGVIDLEHWPTWARLLFQALGGRDGDNRSWPNIDGWADQIARALDRNTASTNGGGTSESSARE